MRKSSTGQQGIPSFSPDNYRKINLPDKSSVSISLFHVENAKFILSKL
jgi:hypothetical protein